MTEKKKDETMNAYLERNGWKYVFIKEKLGGELEPTTSVCKREKYEGKVKQVMHIMEAYDFQREEDRKKERWWYRFREWLRSMPKISRNPYFQLERRTKQ